MARKKNRPKSDRTSRPPKFLYGRQFVGGATCKMAAHTKITVVDLRGRVLAYFFSATLNFAEISCGASVNGDHTKYLAVYLYSTIRFWPNFFSATRNFAENSYGPSATLKLSPTHKILLLEICKLPSPPNLIVKPIKKWFLFFFAPHKIS